MPAFSFLGAILPCPTSKTDTGCHIGAHLGNRRKYNYSSENRLNSKGTYFEDY